jgi:hypothetical protein
MHWLTRFRSIDKGFLKLAAQRRDEAVDVLRAQPVAGEVDHAELSREFMARFPKIRAALAYDSLRLEPWKSKEGKLN